MPLLFALLISSCTELIEGPVPGVALELAELRARAIAGLVYDIHLAVPASLDEAVAGRIDVQFELADAGAPLVLDFRAPPENVLAVRLNGASVQHSLPPDHIVIPASELSTGSHELSVEFISTDTALNRQQDFFYALFVPDRASTALPVFEQPNLKARFSLTLEIPSQWQALSNGALLSRESSSSGRDLLRFATTRPISTYLFSFAAGELQVETALRNGRELNMYHRETDSESLERNREAIFDLHATALTWLEDYTGIPYPFDKFDFFAVPDFQFGGMEHPGAIWYRASSLFLDPTASRSRQLARASLIAHETAHMWFGDLVTMEWFNDVWMKEVFANFMAAKIAGPAFPDLDLSLRFFQRHHPGAYDVDRTPGTNAIRQQLDNLREAGSLYGAIIYEKAPVVVQQLEALIGEEQLQAGLRSYLAGFAYGNATWPDLVSLLDELSDEDLLAWSQVWVNETGRPRITVEWGDGGIRVRQSDPQAGRDLNWNQPVVLAVGSGGSVREYRVQLRDSEAFVPVASVGEPDFVFAGADGIGYGRFVLDERSRETLLANVNQLERPLHRAVVWQTLWEEMLDGELAPARFAAAAVIAVGAERDELVAQQVQGLLGRVFWQFLDAGQRQSLSADLEQVLWEALQRAPGAAQKGSYFSSLVNLTTSPQGTDRLVRIWRGDEQVEGLPLQEQQFINLAEALALRLPLQADAIMDTQQARIENPDRLARLQFVRPAYSADAGVREALFESFAAASVRRQESWVLGAMGAIHHPIRNEASLHLLRPGLDLLEEIQRTGDIFFPLNWLNAMLQGYGSQAAAAVVRQYLADNPQLPMRLRGKAEQAVDDLYRAASMASR